MVGVGKHTRRLCRTGLFPVPFALDCPELLEGRRGHKGRLRQPPSNHAWAAIGTDPPHTNQAFCPQPSGSAYHERGGCGGRPGLGSYLIKRSEGLKTRATPSSNRGPHNAEAKPIYWLIGRRCYCGVPKSRVSGCSPPILGGHPPSPPRGVGSCP